MNKSSHLNTSASRPVLHADGYDILDLCTQAHLIEDLETGQSNLLSRMAKLRVIAKQQRDKKLAVAGAQTSFCF
ncbi:hypothetical protein [Paraglaciecola sp. 2405UD69-4]|uniref:hypothetical protein n=1 Tax=Paraglaciecola sp. 2405UD69-4 TaxID=3391836 RepID=UPI0039C9BF93